MKDDTVRDVKPNGTYGEIRRHPPGEAPWEKARGERYWSYRRRWSEYPKTFYVSDFPLNLDIETTNVCDLKCVMCPRTILIAEKRYGKIGMMSFDLYRRLLDEGIRYPDFSAVKLNYLGEPLLHPDVVKQVRYAKEIGVIDVMFNTNATHLTEEMSHALLEAGLDNIFFSVDSIDPDRYNKIRIGADYDTVVGNILRFLEIKEKGGYQRVQTRVSLTVLDHEVEELRRFASFWLEKVDAVGFGVYHDTHGDESPYNPAFSCAQPYQRLFVMWDGVCTPCCVDDKRGYIVGRFGERTLHHIWHGPEYEKLREAMKTGRYKEIDICRKCYMPATSLDGQVFSLEAFEKRTSVQELTASVRR